MFYSLSVLLSVSATDVEETLRRLREDFKSPPTALPPLLRRCRAGVGLNVVFSAREVGVRATSF